MPGALYEVGTAVVVALSVAPQLVESVLRVRRARRLRGGRQRGLRAVRGIAMPVLVDALDRSLALAAAMDSRGYGRRAGGARGPAGAGALLVGGLLGVCVGVYGLLDGDHAALPGPADAGCSACCRRRRAAAGRPAGAAQRLPAGPVAGGRDRWSPRAALAAAAVLVLTAGWTRPTSTRRCSPLTWPELPLAGTLGVLLAVLPAWLAPPPVAGRSRPTAGGRAASRSEAAA